MIWNYIHHERRMRRVLQAKLWSPDHEFEAAYSAWEQAVEVLEAHRARVTLP